MVVLFVPLSVCEALVDVGQVLQRVEEVFRWEAEGSVHLAEPGALRMTHDDPPAKFHSKAVLLPELGVAGFRVVGYRIRADGSGPSSPDSTRLVVLVDLATGSPLAIVDEHHNYTMRTAASVGVAMRYLAPGRPVLGLVGAGGVAHAVARVFLAILPLEQILITSRRAQSRQRLVDTVRGWTDVPVSAVADVDSLADHANLVVTATTVRHPLLGTRAVRPGTTLCALGSFEFPLSVYRTVDKLVVDDWSQTRAAHDVRPWVESGALAEEHLHAELAGIVAGTRPGRESAHETILVRTEGMVSQDVALAHWVYQEADRRGLGIKL